MSNRRQITKEQAERIMSTAIGSPLAAHSVDEVMGARRTLMEALLDASRLICEVDRLRAEVRQLRGPPVFEVKERNPFIEGPAPSASGGDEARCACGKPSRHESGWCGECRRNAPVMCACHDDGPAMPDGRCATCLLLTNRPRATEGATKEET